MKYIIHRGITSKTVKENTYTSLKKALRDNNSKGVEFDIRLTKDNIIVLSHNSVIKNKVIETTNYKDLIKEITITTLDKILSINTNKILLIDIKVKNNNKKFINAIIKYLNNKKDTKNIYLCSFNKKIINNLRKKTSYKTGYINLKYKTNKNHFNMINHNTILQRDIPSLKDKTLFIWTIHNYKELKEIQNNLKNINNYYLIIDKEE